MPSQRPVPQAELGQESSMEGLPWEQLTELHVLLTVGGGEDRNLSPALLQPEH